MQTSTFEAYVLGLLAVLERLPIPLAIAFDRECARVQGNRAFRRLTDLPMADDLPLQRAAREGVEVVDMAVRADLIASAWPLRDTEGRIAGSIGVFVDVTQSKEAERRAQQAMHALYESERRYRLITEAMPEFVWLDAPDGSALYSNKRWLDYTGLTEEQNEGFGWERVVHPDDLKRLETERERTLLTGEAYEGECRYRGRDGKYRWFLFRSIPVRDEDGAITSWLGTATDIDKQKRAEAQHAFFALASDVLGSTLDVETTLERIARLAIASLGTWCQIDVPDVDGRLRVAVVAHQDPEKEAVLARLVDRHVYNDEARLGPPAVFATLKPQLLQNVEADAVSYVIPRAEDRKIYAQAGYAAGLMVPLSVRGRVLGVLGIASDDPTRLYTDFDVATALELGRRGASALDNAHSFAREHRVATTLQRALLPSALPQSPHVEFHSAYSSASSSQGEAVGGDWYDAFELEDGRIAVSIGDVAGHGIDAAVTMSAVRQAIRAAAFDGRSPAQVLERANALIAREQRKTPMITALYGVFDTATREFRYSVAGHPRPIAVRDGGTIEELPGDGLPLGQAFDPQHVRVHDASLDADSAIVFYTDGLVEYRKDIIEAMERLTGVLRDRTFLNHEQPAQRVIDLVLDAPQRDDIAVLVMRIPRKTAT